MTAFSRTAHRPALLAGLSFFALSPELAHACACGCGVFDVGDGTTMANETDSGFSLWGRYAFMNQNQNWEGNSKGPAADNGDKEIKTSFYTIGGSYMLNHSWSFMVELPTYQRALTTTDDGTVLGPAGAINTRNITALGDLQVMATYTGFKDGMNTGLTFGLKLPTGDYTGPNGPLGGAEFDRDSLPGTGSTDLIVGGYHADAVPNSDQMSWFVQARYEFAIDERNSYRPGNEFDAAAGLVYNFGRVGSFTKVAPLIQVIDSYRDRDSGANADPLNSGYERVLIAPGIQVRYNKVKLYADVALPVFQRTNHAANVNVSGTEGQLVAPALFKVQLGYDF